MKRLLIAVLSLILAGAARAQEINDLSTSAGVPPPDFTNQPLGLPAFIWWALAVLGVAGLVSLGARWNGWFFDRLSEPSTSIATAVFVGATGLFINSLRLDPDPMGQGFLLAATVFAFLGLIGRDREGPLL